MQLLKKFVLLFSLGFLISCITDFKPAESENYIDPKIVGVWYKINNFEIQGRPDLSISGFQISKDGYMYRLGIEIETGNLHSFSDTKYSSIVKNMRNGEMEIFYPQNGMVRENTYFQKYDVNESSLTFFHNGGGLTVYEKSKIGENVTNPVVSEFFTIVDSDTFTNASIWNYPSAYSGEITYNLDSLLYEFYARSNNNRAIRIHLTNFTGIGTYILGTGNDGMGYFEEIGGCMIGVSHTELPNSGHITISEYDIQNGICGGTFEFFVHDHYMDFTEGRFRIPIYD